MSFPIVLQHPVDRLALAIVDWFSVVALPKMSFEKHGSQHMVRIIDGAIQAIEEPGKPGRNVKRTALCGLELEVVFLAVSFDTRRHAVETIFGFISLG